MITTSLFGLTGCLEDGGVSGPTKNPIDTLPTFKPVDTLPWPAEATLFHTGIKDTLWPLEISSESVFVRGGVHGQWSISIVTAPQGTTFSGNSIHYRLPEGLIAPQSVHVVAVQGASVLESTWTVLVHPHADHSPIIDWVHTPNWAIPGVPMRLILHAYEPDGEHLDYGGNLPEGAAWHDSVFEWTPTLAQAGHQNFNLLVTDPRGHAASFNLSFTVLDFDPRPYLADFKPGRHWHIRGYTKMKSESPVTDDSIQIDRSVTLLSAISDSGDFSFRVQDTLSGTRQGISDTVYTARFRIGNDFWVDKLTGMIPFAWPAEATAVENVDFALGGQVFHGRREINANTCLDPSHSKYGCGGGERTFAEGLGLVSMRVDGEVLFVHQVSRDAYDVVGMSDP
ncbi:MAG: hypothetical protein JF616_14035 [Fibrobacteres bacterium]|nr:hypothetical protein [Fibrobacterota bacterium]